jgi:hypothetical protein
MGGSLVSRHATQGYKDRNRANRPYRRHSNPHSNPPTPPTLTQQRRLRGTRTEQFKRGTHVKVKRGTRVEPSYSSLPLHTAILAREQSSLMVIGGHPNVTSSSIPSVTVTPPSPPVRHLDEHTLSIPIPILSTHRNLHTTLIRGSDIRGRNTRGSYEKVSNSRTPNKQLLKSSTSTAPSPRPTHQPFSPPSSAPTSAPWAPAWAWLPNFAGSATVIQQLSPGKEDWGKERGARSVCCVESFGAIHYCLLCPLSHPPITPISPL